MSASDEFSLRKRLLLRGHLVAAVVVTAVGLLVSCWICWQLRRSEWRSMVFEFRHQAHQQVDAVSEAVSDRLFVLDAIRFFFDASVHVDRGEFATATVPWLDRLSDLRQLTWIPRVRYSERQRFEVGAQEDGLAGFQFIEPDGSGTYRQAAIRDEYYPVYYLEPNDLDSATAGLDLSLDPNCGPALTLARDTGQVVATAPLTLRDDAQNSVYLQILAPAYEQQGKAQSVRDRRQNLRGIVRGVFNVNRMIRTDGAPTPNGLLNICIRDVTEPGHEQLVYVGGAHAAIAGAEPRDLCTGSTNVPHYDEVLDIGGRRWAMSCAPTEEFIRQKASLSPWLGLIGSLSFTGLISTWLVTLARHTSRIENMVEQRTAKLRDSQESLRRQKALLGMVVGHIPSLVFWKNRELVYLGCNESFASVAGVASPEAIVGKTDDDLAWTREETESYRRSEQMVVDNGEGLLNVEESQLQADGREAVVLASRVPLHDQDGSIIGLIGVCSDITERKRDEERLEALQKALDDASDAIAIIDKDGTVTYINVAFQEQFRIPLDGLNEVGWQSIFADENVASMCFTTIMKLDNWSGEAELQSQEDHQFPAELRCTPILDAVLLPTGMLLFIRDITDRKRAESDLREHVEQVETLNAELQTETARAERARNEAEAANAELTLAHIEAQEARVKAERAREDLEKAQQQLLDASHRAGMAEVATGVLHNVGNVLNSVTVSAGLLVEQSSRSKLTNLARAVAMLQENHTHMAEFLTSDPRGQKLPTYLVQVADHLQTEQDRLVSELQELTRNIDHIRDIVSTQQSYAGTLAVIHSFDLEQVVEDALQMSGSTFEQHGITIGREYARLDAITADRQKVLQVLINLLSNARHSLRDCDHEDRHLTIQIGGSDADVARVEITDDGVGIPAELIDKVFLHGFTTKPAGHGFGLHHSMLLVQEMRGSLTVRSDGAGMGATFTLELPMTSERHTHDK